MKVSSRAVLSVVLLGAVGTWIISASSGHWSDLATPQAIGGLLLGLGNTLGAAFGVHTDPQHVIESTVTTTPDGASTEVKKITNTGIIAVPPVEGNPK